MKHDNVIELKQPEGGVADGITELLRAGAQELLKKAIEAELKELLAQYADKKVAGKAAVIRNGYLPEREIKTGIGSVIVKVPKVRDRSGEGIKFNSELVPPYLKRTQNLEDFLPLLYLRGISTGDFNDTLSALFGEQAKGFSAGTISRLKTCWEEEYAQWYMRDLTHHHYVYVWADGIYFNVRAEESKQCILVVLGVTEKGEKELVAIDEGYRESEQSWHELLQGLVSRGLKKAPLLAIGDGALGLWKALAKTFPETRHQRCWVHKTANVLNKLPKAVQSKVKSHLQNIWMAETREAAYQAFSNTLACFEDKYGKAMECLAKDKEKLLAFYDFPALHWQHIRTTNPIESTFATVRLRTDKTKNCGSRKTILAMVFRLVQSAQKRWNRIRGFEHMADVIRGVPFVNGVKAVNNIQDNADRMVA